ncbi:MAG: DUF6220 domain-containing protein, partial [Candidatus Limnocylindria bacterium]
MTRWFRYAYFGSLVLFLAGLVFQIYLVGQSLFVDPRDWRVHVEWGWLVAHGLPALVLISGALSRLGRRRWVVLLVFFIAVAIHPLLPAFRDTSPLLAVLHPINAVFLVVLTLWLLKDAWHLIRTQEPEAPATPPAPPPAATG